MLAARGASRLLASASIDVEVFWILREPCFAPISIVEAAFSCTHTHTYKRRTCKHIRLFQCTLANKQVEDLVEGSSAWLDALRSALGSKLGCA